MLDDEIKKIISENEVRETEREKKRNAELEFEDQSWICIGSGFTLGILGLIMYFKYSGEGYKKKASQVCVLAIVSFISLIVLSVLVNLSKH